MPKIIFLRGLPGSGKSTYAITLCNARAKTVRVNKDDIRLKNGKPWSKEIENEIILQRDNLIKSNLIAGNDVISDDTNFAPKHEQRLRQIAAQCQAKFELDEQFLAVPIETCIERDSKREGSAKVGEKVIRDMASQYLNSRNTMTPTTYAPDTKLPQAVICDLDGTLCLHNGRSPYDYEKCDTDLLNTQVKFILDSVKLRGVKVIYLSGREDLARGKTLSWLEDHECPVGLLFMRKAGDFRKDNIIKREIFDSEIAPNYNVLFALDDRDQVVKLWRDMGLTCLQVNYGAF